jgi:hypothetical protein
MSNPGDYIPDTLEFYLLFLYGLLSLSFFSVKFLSSFIGSGAERVSKSCGPGGSVAVD